MLGGEIMKTQYIFLGIVGVTVVIGGFLLLNNKSTPKDSSSAQNVTAKQEEIKTAKPAEGNMMGVGYILKNGKMMVEENGKFNPMTEDTTLKDGTVVTTSGKVTKKDGSTFTLTEGQSMWTDGSFVKEEAMMKGDGVNTNSALSTRYIDYSSDNLAKATANNGNAVIWFAALAWCPSCQAADRDFKAHFDKVPKDVTIMKINYDTAKELKQKYAITIQDTFIQIDSKGSEIIRWNSGGQGTDALLANLK